MYSPIIHSILDTDFYKLTMQQVVFHYFSKAHVEYTFINRNKEMKWPTGFAAAVRKEVENMEELRLRRAEFMWLRNLGYFKEDYLEFLRNYRFNASHVDIPHKSEEFSLTVHGPWFNAILWEVPLLAIISETYYKMTNTKWHAFSIPKIRNKADFLSAEGCCWIDFGTRRRFSYQIQDLVNCIMPSKSGYLGTSNPHFAMKYGIKPQGTYAHEAVMAMQGTHFQPSYDCQNEIWLNLWRFEYGDKLQIALTDTLTTKFFLKNLSLNQAKYLSGFRQDSGDPAEIADQILKFYKERGIDARTKTIVFSDGLDVKQVTLLQREFGHKINCIYGIGTNLTNDCGAAPLNIVIKLNKIKIGENGPNAQWKNVVKLSDTPGKESGAAAEVEAAKSYISNSF